MTIERAKTPGVAAERRPFADDAKVDLADGARKAAREMGERVVEAP